MQNRSVVFMVTHGGSIFWEVIDMLVSLLICMCIHGHFSSLLHDRALRNRQPQNRVFEITVNQSEQKENKHRFNRICVTTAWSRRKEDENSKPFVTLSSFNYFSLAGMSCPPYENIIWKIIYTELGYYEIKKRKPLTTVSLTHHLQ